MTRPAKPPPLLGRRPVRLTLTPNPLESHTPTSVARSAVPSATTLASHFITRKRGRGPKSPSFVSLRESAPAWLRDAVREAQSRAERLLPGGTPRYVRAYDNRGASFDRYTIVFTGRYRKSARDEFVYLGCSTTPRRSGYVRP